MVFKGKKNSMVEVFSLYWVSMRSRNIMVAISMYLLNKQDEIKTSIFLDGGGVVFCMNNISKVIWG
jgi:hypothetical protein